MAAQRPSLTDTLRQVARDLDELATPWAPVGGLTVSARAEPRTTRDAMPWPAQVLAEGGVAPLAPQHRGSPTCLGPGRSDQRAPRPRALRPHLARPRQLRVAPLRGQALAEAIKAPARALGVTFEPRLAERLVADAADEPGALPLLQETLRLLWAGRALRLVRLRDYEALGVEGKSNLAAALALRADAALGALSPPERRVARRMFVRLVSFGEGRPNTRRQQPKMTLLSLGDNEAQAAHVLGTLTEARLLTAGDTELAGESVRDPQTAYIDLAHEALIEGRPALTRWLGELQGAEQTRRRLESKDDEWRRLGRGRGGLLDAEELPEFDAWQKSEEAAELGIAPDLPALVEHSRAALTRRQRVRTGVIASLLTLLTVVTGLAGGLFRPRASTEKALVVAVSAAKDLTFSIESDLQTVAGASAARAMLLRRSNELVATLEKLAGERGDVERVPATTLALQADLSLEQGNLPKALALYQQAHVYFVRQAEAAPANAQRRKDAVISHVRLLDVCARRRRRDEAQAHYREAVTQLGALEREGLLRHDVQVPQLRAELEAQRRKHRLAPAAR